jgi:hypothetical protein
MMTMFAPLGLGDKRFSCVLFALTKKEIITHILKFFKENNMSNELTLFGGESLELLYKACATLSKSKMIPVSLQNKQEDIFAILVMGNELGIKPMQALNSINVIQGKPTVSPQLMIAMIKGKLPDSVIDIKSDEVKGIVTCTTSRSRQEYKDGLFYTASWDMTKADKMGLSMKDNYKKQAETMLRWRAVAESCRMTFPDIIMGLYVAEEFKDFDGEPLKPTSSSESDLDKDFPIPAEEKVIGDLYRVQNGKFRSKQLKDLTQDDMAEYREELIKRTTPKKDWEINLIYVFGEYLKSLEGNIVVA